MKPIADILEDAARHTPGPWRTDVLPFDKRPGRQFIRIEGWKEHSGGQWYRLWVGEAFIRPDDAPDGILGYRRSDIERMMRDGDMDGVDRVLAWMPAIFPPHDATLARGDTA